MAGRSDGDVLRRLSSLCLAVLWAAAACDAPDREANDGEVDPPTRIEAADVVPSDVEPAEAAAGGLAAAPSDSPAEWVPVRIRRIETAEPTPADEPLLYNPRALFRFQDGTLVVQDMGPHRLVVLDPEDGGVRARFAPAGSGPGEVRGDWLQIGSEDGESITVLDLVNVRLSRFSRDGEILSELRYASPGAGAEHIAIRYDTGDLFAVIRYIDTEGGRSDMTDSIARLDLQTGVFEPLVGLGPRPPRPPGALPGMVLFHPRPLVAALPGGGIISGRTDGAPFRHHSSSGELIREFRLPLTARPVRDRDLQEISERAASATGGAMPRDGLRTSSHFNMFNTMYAVDDSLFAIQHSRLAAPAEDTPAPDDVVYWRIISVRGNEVARVMFPARFAPLFVHQRRVLGLSMDSLGIASIEEFELVALGRATP